MVENMMRDDGAKNIPPDAAETLKSNCTEAREWLQANEFGTKEEYESKKKQLESVIGPIIASMQGSPGGDGEEQGVPPSMPTPSSADNVDDGPKIEEID